MKYMISGCPLGYYGVMLNDNLIYAVEMGDTEADVRHLLLQHEAWAQAMPHDAHYTHIAEAFEAYFAGAPLALTLALDTAGTTFQRKVWHELATIPLGSTRTYAQIAEAIGSPTTASRAVGQACADNRLALLVPCHRVIRMGGELGSFRWGLERKIWLLRHEGALLM